MQKSLISNPDSRYIRRPLGGPLPFRSRDAAINHVVTQPQDHGVKWHDMDNSDALIQNGTVDHRLSSSNKENVDSWLETTSPTSVIEQAQDEKDPPSPSPICSPSPSSPLSSPRPSVSAPRTLGEPSSELPTKVVRSDGAGTSSSNSKRYGKEIVLSSSIIPPESPTGSSFSSGSEGGLLALLASKLFSYKEHSRFSSRYARERSGPIDDKHVMEDRASKPPVEEISIGESLQSDRSVPGHNYLHRTSSLEAPSELSLGSANDRSLSMEFDAMLAAAVAAGVRQADTLERQDRLGAATADESTAELRGIEEDHSFSSSPAADSTVTLYHGDDQNVRGLERSGDRTGMEGWIVTVGAQSVETDSTGEGIYDALTATRRGGAESAGMDIADSISEMPLSSRSSSRGSRRADSEGPQIVRTNYALPQSSSNSRTTSSASSSNGCHRDSLALVLVNNKPLEATSSTFSSVANAAGTSQGNLAPNSRKQALEKVRRDKTLAQALAYQDAKNSQYNNRYIREEAKIKAWENQQKIKATVNMRKAEMKLEEKRAKALEKMQNEIALAHKKAEERKASAEAVRGMKLSKAAEVANHIKRTGKVPSGCLPF